MRMLACSVAALAVLTASAPALADETAPFSLGALVGYRDWTDDGFAHPTLSLGGRVSLAYDAEAELEARGAYLDTGGNELSSASGWSLSAGHVWLLPVMEGGSVSGTLGAGYESQTTRLDSKREYLFGRAGVGFRYELGPALFLDAGAEGGAGLLDGEQGAADDATGGDSAFVAYYGAVVTLSWRLGVSDGAGTEESTSDEPTRKPEGHGGDTETEDIPDEDELW